MTIQLLSIIRLSNNSDCIQIIKDMKIESTINACLGKLQTTLINTIHLSDHNFM